MSNGNEPPRILPVSYDGRNSTHGPLVLPYDFTDFERRDIYKDALTAYEAAGAYMRDMEELEGHSRSGPSSQRCGHLLRESRRTESTQCVEFR